MVLALLGSAVLPPSRPARAVEQVLGNPITVQSGPIGVAVNKVTNRIYVANLISNSLSVVDGLTNTKMGDIGVGSNSQPRGVAVDEVNNLIYVTRSGTSSVLVINGAAPPFGQIVASITVGSMPYGIAVDSSTRTIYVANLGDDTLSVIDGFTNIAYTAPSTGDQPRDVAFDKTNDKVYVANSGTGIGANTVSVIRASDNVPLSPITVGTTPFGLAVNPTTNKIYVANFGSNNVSVIDGANDTVVGTITVGTQPFGVGVNQTTNRVYVTNFGGQSISVINGLTNSTDGAAIALGSGKSPAGVSVNLTTGFVYVANNGDSSVTVLGVPFLAESVITSVHPLNEASVAVNPTTNRVYVLTANAVTVLDGTTLQPVAGSPIAVTAFAWSLAVNARTNRVYVTQNHNDSVTEIDGATNTILRSIPLGAGTGPQGLAVNPITNTVYVANFSNSSVGVIDANNNYAVTSVKDPINLFAPDNVAVNPATNRVYAASSAFNRMIQIDAANNNAVTGLVFGTPTNGVAVNSVTNRLYRTVPSPATVFVTDLNGLTPVASVVVGSSPAGVAVNETTNRVYVANKSSGTISVIDGATSTVVGATIFAPGNPFSLALNPNTNRLYVTAASGAGLPAIGPTYSLSTSGAPPSGTGSTVQVTWGGALGAAPNDFVGLFTPGSANGSPLALRFTNNTASPGSTGVPQGTATLTIPSNQAPGRYEIRLVSGILTDGAVASLAYAVFGPPVLPANKSYSTNSGAKLTVPVATGLLENATDPDTDKALLQAQVVTQPAHGQLALQPNGAFTYTPTGAYSGPDSFTFRAVDPQSLTSLTRTASITVNLVACGPRPSVVLATQIVGGALQVTVTATTTNTPSNRLVELRFGDFQSDRNNALVARNGVPVANNQTVTLPANTTSTTFTATRKTAGKATTVPVTVVDTCGTWPTFVGGGPSAGF